MAARGLVTIDCFPSSLDRYDDSWAVVAIDVIRATTTAVTAVARGRRCFPVASLEQARTVADGLTAPVLAGERDGLRPEGFEEQNSPTAFASRTDTHRPLVLLSTSGTQLLQGVTPGHARYAACLRNASATVAHLARHHDRVAVIGAGTHGEFREEDVLGCSWVAGGLVRAGYSTDRRTRALLFRWCDQPVEVVARSKSAAYLRRTGQVADLEYVMTHVDDLRAPFVVRDGELVIGGCRRADSPCGAA